MVNSDPIKFNYQLQLWDDANFKFGTKPETYEIVRLCDIDRLELKQGVLDDKLKKSFGDN